MRRAEGRSATIVGPRGKAGTYQVRWRYAGKTQSLTVANKAAANTVRKHVHEAGCDLLASAASELAFGTTTPRTTANSARLFSDVAEDKFATMTNRNTVSQQRTSVRAMPFANSPVHEVTPDEVNAWLDDLRRVYEPSTIRTRGILVQSVLRFAMDNGYRTDNPCKAIKLPRQRRRHAAITPDHFAAVVEATASPVYRALWHLLTFTGLRIGEALTLQAGDVDLAGGRLWVLRALDGNRRDVGEGKTSGSVDKPVTLDPTTIDVLRPFVVGKAPTDWVFSKPDGSRLVYETTRNAWHKAREAAGLPATVRIHDLRHSHATWLINDGVPLPVVSRRLRHARLSTTADTYSDIDPVGEAAILASLASRLPSTRPTPIKRRRTA